MDKPNEHKQDSFHDVPIWVLTAYVVMLLGVVVAIVIVRFFIHVV
jgi:hypothetical protein